MVRKKKEPNRVDDMLDALLADCQGPEDILGESGLLKQLSVRLVERALAGELSHHLAHDETSPEANSERRNSRNGYSKKTVQSTQGDLELAIPRDRNGDFDPILVPKHQRRLSGLDEKILAMYARGTSTRDISAQLEELYGAKASASLISEVTDAVSEDVKAWQCRPLDEVYPTSISMPFTSILRSQAESANGPSTSCWALRWRATKRCSACGLARRKRRGLSSG